MFLILLKVKIVTFMVIKKLFWLTSYKFLSYLKSIINKLMFYFLVKLNSNYKRVEVKNIKWKKRGNNE